MRKSLVSLIATALVLLVGASIAAPVCGALITGDTVLSSNLTGCLQDGLIIGADSVTLDCAGHSLSGTGNGYGIHLADTTNVTVKNCDISGFANGVYVDHGSNNLLSGNDIHGNGGTGVFAEASKSNTFTGNTVSANAGNGFYMYVGSDSNTLDGNTIQDNSQNGIYLQGDAGIVKNNLITGQTQGFEHTVGNGIFIQGYGNHITSNTLVGNVRGLALYIGPSAFLNDVANNTATSNLEYGFLNEAGGYTSVENRFTGNTASGNKVGFAMVGSNYWVVKDNIASDNTQTGFEFKEVSYLENSVEGNSATGSQYGFLVENVTPLMRLTGNNAADNVVNVRVTDSVPNVPGYGVNISQNAIVGGGYGIEVSSSQGVVIENNAVSGSSGFGISTDTSSGLTISSNTVDATGMQEGIELSGLSGSTVEGNSVSGSSDAGIDIFSGTGNIFDSNELFNNYHGLVITGLSTGNTVSGNNVHNNAEVGIASIGLFGLNPSGNVFSSNTLDQNGIGYGFATTYNNVIDSGAVTNSLNNGVVLELSDTNSIKNLGVAGSGTDGVLLDSSNYNHLTNVNVSSSGGNGINITNSTGTVIDPSYSCGSPAAGLSLAASTGTSLSDLTLCDNAIGIQYDTLATQSSTTLSNVTLDNNTVDTVVANDEDMDGVDDSVDACPASVPDTMTLNPDDIDPSLKPNQYGQTDWSTSAFEVGPNHDQSLVYNMTVTRGCTCAQIVEKLGAGDGNLKKGCSPGVMENWTGVSSDADRQAGIGKIN